MDPTQSGFGSGLQSAQASLQRNIRKFQFSMCKPNRVFLVVGKRGSGKSLLLLDILHKTSNMIDFALAMTATIPTQKKLSRHIARQYVRLGGYDHDLADKFLQVCKALVQNKARRRNMALILDDCIGGDNGKFLKGNTISSLVLNGRHFHSSLYITTQYLMTVPPAIRSNTDYVFVLAESSRVVRKKIWETFFGMISTFVEFEKFFSVATQHYSALVLDTTQSSNNIEDCVFWYKAKVDTIPTDFHIGRKCFDFLKPKSHPDLKRLP